MSAKKEELKNIQQETIIKNEENKKKRGRGRPPKNEEKSINSPRVAPSPNEGVFTGLKTSFISIFIFIGKSLSTTLKYKDFELEKNEAELLGEQADQVVIEFFPQINNRYAKLGIFLTSLISIFGKKYFGYASEMEKQEKIKKAKKENETSKENENTLVINPNKTQTPNGEFMGFNVLE